MADVLIEGGMWGSALGSNHQNAVYWTTPLIGYAFGLLSVDFSYYKTEDGGATWTSAIAINTGTVIQFTIWAEEWTANDKTKTIIHTWYIDQAAGTIYHRTLDTSDDSLGTEHTLKTGLTVDSGGAGKRFISGIKCIGGNLLVAARWGVAAGLYKLFRSTDGGINWTERVDIYVSADGMCLLLPGNVSAGDTQDAWGIYHDSATDILSLKEYDDSADSIVTETTIATGMLGGFASGFGAAQRSSDDHVIVAIWNRLDHATSDIKVFDIGSNSSITAKADVLTDQEEAAHCPVFINQQNDDIYVAYIKGTAFGSLVKTFYKTISASDFAAGNAWGAEQAMSVDAEDDLRLIVSSNGVGDNGGMFGPIWVNDDLNDLFFNADNAVPIAAAGVGSIVPILMRRYAS